MLAQGWHYPRFASRGAGDLEEAVIEGIIRADIALDSLPGEHIDFDDLIADESVLRDALAKLYPGIAIQEFKFNESFHTRARTVSVNRPTITFFRPR
jgi:hypothetical protein